MGEIVVFNNVTLDGAMQAPRAKLGKEVHGAEELTATYQPVR